MKIGDLVTFCPEAWGTPLEDRPLGVVVGVTLDDAPWPSMVTALFPSDDIPYSSKIEDFEVVNEDW
jgi:hypothetical protein